MSEPIPIQIDPPLLVGSIGHATQGRAQTNMDGFQGIPTDPKLKQPTEKGGLPRRPQQCLKRSKQYLTKPRAQAAPLDKSIDGMV